MRSCDFEGRCENNSESNSICISHSFLLSNKKDMEVGPGVLGLAFVSVIWWLSHCTEITISGICFYLAYHNAVWLCYVVLSYSYMMLFILNIFICYFIIYSLCLNSHKYLLHWFWKETHFRKKRKAKTISSFFFFFSNKYMRLFSRSLGHWALKCWLIWHWESATPSSQSSFLADRIIFQDPAPMSVWHATVSSASTSREFIVRQYAWKILSYLICLLSFFKKQTERYFL